MAVLPVTFPFTADERAPNVFVAMRRRITAALEAGERPSLRGNNLRLGSVILQRADGRDAPALREVELQMGRRHLETAGAFDVFQPATIQRSRNTCAKLALLLRRITHKSQAAHEHRQCRRSPLQVFAFAQQAPNYRQHRDQHAPWVPNQQ